MNDPTSAKQAMRREMRALRRRIAESDGADRSQQASAHLIDVIAQRGATIVVLYDAVPGEVDVTPVAAWCHAHDVAVVVPDSSPEAEHPIAAHVPDVIVLPGLAFSPRGARLGQGGGWFDRFVADRRDDCLLVGVCFREQLVETIPVESHDVDVDLIVTDAATTRRQDAHG